MHHCTNKNPVMSEKQVITSLEIVESEREREREVPAWLFDPTGPVCEVEIWVLCILHRIHHRLCAAKVHKYIILPKYSTSLVNKWQTFILQRWAPRGETMVRWGKIYNRLLMGNHVAWNQDLRTLLQRVRGITANQIMVRFLNDIGHRVQFFFVIWWWKSEQNGVESTMVNCWLTMVELRVNSFHLLYHSGVEFSLSFG